MHEIIYARVPPDTSLYKYQTKSLDALLISRV